jgi:tripartite-type tricarboxylate transporter receptor subunit TctC
MATSAPRFRFSFYGRDSNPSTSHGVAPGRPAGCALAWLFLNLRGVRSMRRRDVLQLLAFFAAMPATSLARAQSAYPSRPIRLIIPRAAGGVLDVVGRDWAEWLRAHKGFSFVAENQGGGGGKLGTNLVAHATPDGYTLLLGSTSDLVLNPVLTINPTFDPQKDFVSIAGIAISVAAIIVHPSVPAKNLKELAAYVKANSGKLSYGSAGTGTMSHLCGELYKKLAGLPDLVHVPYKGAAAGYADLIAGHVPIMAINVTPTMLAMHREGRVRILAVATEHRIDAGPDIPTAAEEGYPDLVAQLFVGVFAPAGTPPMAVQTLAKGTREALEDKDFRAKLDVAGFTPVRDFGPEKTTRYLKQEAVRWTPILESAGLKKE